MHCYEYTEKIDRNKKERKHTEKVISSNLVFCFKQYQLVFLLFCSSHVLVVWQKYFIDHNFQLVIIDVFLYYRDAMILPILDTFTSLFAGCVVFSTLGYMAEASGVSIDDVVSQGVLIRVTFLETAQIYNSNI